MKRIECFLRKYIDVIYALFGIVVVLSVLIVNYIALGNNLIPSDEGWYLCLLRDCPVFGTTRFHLLFKGIFGSNIHAIRICNFSLSIIGAFFFAFGLGYYFVNRLLHQEQQKRKWLFYLVALGIVYCGQMGIVSCPSLNYISLNIVIAEIGMGFLLIGLVREKWIYYVCSGFAISFLFPVMITNVLIIPVMCIVIWLLSSNKKRHLLAFIGGCLLFVIYYLAVIESPKSVFEFLLNGTTQTVSRGSSDYGVIFLVKWLVKVGLYMFRCALIALLLYAQYYVIRYKTHLAIGVKNTICLFTTAIILGWALKYIPPYIPCFQFGILMWMHDILWILLFVDIIWMIVNRKAIDIQRLVIGGCLLFMPIALSFGTNVSFYIRQGCYLSFLLAAIYFFSLNNSLTKKAILLFVLMAQFALFVNGWKGENWHGEKWFGNKVPVSTIGINQKVAIDAPYIKRVETCRQLVPQGKILCDSETWGFVSLLDYTPITYDFDITRLDMESIQAMVDNAMKGEKGLWVVSQKWHTKFIDKINQLQGYEIKNYIYDFDEYFYLTPITDEE